MDLESSRRHRKKKRWWSSCMPRSCFGTLQSSSTSRGHQQSQKGTKRASCLPWSFRDVKRSLSVNRATSAIVPELDEDEEEDGIVRRRDEIPVIVVAAVRPSFLQRFFTKRDKGTRKSKSKPQASKLVSSQESPSEIVVLPRPPSPENQTITTSRSPPRSDPTRNGSSGQSSPCPLILRPNASAPKPQCSKNSDSLAGFVVLMVMLLMLAVGGRLFAITCTCAFFYISSYLKASSPPSENEGNPNKGKMPMVDYESEKYRKKVLLEGLLERNGKRPTIL